jgi:glycosyltransferase involved in cell wall biosynthesis
MKQLCVISAPPDTYSGYGARSRDFIKAIYELKKDEWDIRIIPQKWGATPWGFIDDNKEEWGWMKELFIYGNQLPAQPDVWFQITIPNEFQPIGKVNIGVTAGIETTLCDPAWIQGCNRMNVTLVSSRHAKQVLETTTYDERNKQTNQLTGKLKLEKPVEVLFEGVDLNKYFYIPEDEIGDSQLVKDLNSIPEEFCYLYVGHWLQGELGEDRKNTSLMIKLFLETFKDKKNKPALILKTSQAGASVMDRDEVLKKIDDIRQSVGNAKQLPNIYLIHGDLEDADINVLYNHPKAKAFISLTKGEGYGRPLAEFCLSKKPIITSGWSGHTDFLNPEFSVLLPGKITQVHPSSVVPGIIVKESFWFSVDNAAAVKAMVDVYENYNKYEVMGKRQGHKIRSEFSYDNMVLLLGTYLDKYTLKQVELKLPQLKKLELPKLQKVK